MQLSNPCSGLLPSASRQSGVPRHGDLWHPSRSRHHHSQLNTTNQLAFETQLSGGTPAPAASRSNAHVVRASTSSSGIPITPLTPLMPNQEPVVPHGGYHFDGTPRRFFEGWYWKVTDPETGDSFALIYSIEDPGQPTAQHAGVGVQVMGPDGYICHFSKDVRTFWADRNSLALGATLTAKVNTVPRGMVSQAEFERCVQHGFQASSLLQQGAIIADDAAADGPAMSTVPNCSWHLDIKPITGWGAANAGSQQATAGWLSVLQVFEPHWQVLMSHGLGTGWVQWGNKRYEFKDAPMYAEKNWGGGFPSKWHWLQCNTWDNQPGLSVTTVGARRALVLGVESIGLGEEDVGLIGITLPSGEFIELVPWTSELEWDVDPWGRWWMKGVNDKYEAIVEAQCDDASGVTLRAPTIANGLTPFCKDSFAGNARIRVWRRGAGSSANGRSPIPLLDATSSSAAVEVGGGPWWAAWSAKAAMKEPFKTLVQLPIDVGTLGKLLPTPFKPPGL